MVISNVSSYLYDKIVQNAFSIVDICNNSSSIVTFEKAGTKANVAAFYNLIILSCPKRASLTITANGEDEQRVINDILKILI